MAGARITIEADLKGASNALEALADQLDGDGRRRLLQDIGEYELGATRERASREVDPDGHTWRALEPAYKRWKARKRPAAPILKFDFHMLGDQLAWQIDGDDVLVGTNAVYGALHQFGGRKGMPPGAAAVPARPWLGISDEDAEEILAITVAHLEAVRMRPEGPSA